MRFPGLILTTDGQALLAKLQAGGTLDFTRVATGSGNMPPDNNVFFAVADGSGVTITNSENGAGGAADVSTGFSVGIVTPGGSSTAQVVQVGCLAANLLSAGGYLTINSPYIGFYVWLRINGAGDDPAPAGKVGIACDLSSLDSAVSVANKLAEALDHHRLALGDLRGLIVEEQDIDIQSVSRVDDVISEVRVVLTNAGLVAGYEFRELGLFATDPDLGEILYAVTNAGDEGDYFPAEGGATLIESDLRIRTVISSTAEVSFSVRGEAYAGLVAFNAHIADPAAHQQMRHHFKNKLINGSFDIWQRGASGHSGSGYQGPDRWYQQKSVMGSIIVTRLPFTIGQSEVPHNPLYFAAVTMNNDHADGSHGDLVEISQRVEDVRTLSGLTGTLSFWAKGAAGGLKMNARLVQNFGTGGAPSAEVVVKHDRGELFDLTTGWNKFTVSFDVPSVSGKTIGDDDNSYLSVNLIMSCPSGLSEQYDGMPDQAGANEIHIAQVQFEEGAAGTVFDARPIAVEQLLCERYCFALLTGTDLYEELAIGIVHSTTNIRCYRQLPCAMRVVPSLVFCLGSSGDMVTNNNLTLLYDIQVGQGTTEKYLRLDFQGSGLPAGDGVSVHTGGVYVILVADAEL